MAQTISHKGTITNIGDNKIIVTINADGGDCSGCAISRLCTKGEQLEVAYRNPEKSLIGQRVIITANTATQRKAVILMLLIPVVLLVAALFVALFAGLSQAVSALVAIGVMILWYIGLYVIRPDTQTRNPFQVEVVK